MVFDTKFIFYSKKLIKSCTGHFFIITALLMPVMLGVGGMLVDVVRWSYYEHALKQAAQTAIITASVPLIQSLEEVSSRAKNSFTFPKQKIEEYLIRNFENNLKKNFTDREVRDIVRDTAVEMNPRKSAYQVVLSSRYDLLLNPLSLFLRSMGIKSWLIQTKAEAETVSRSYHKEHGVSIQWVIDFSRSMLDYQRDSEGQPLNCFGQPADRTVKSYSSQNGKVGIRDEKLSPYMVSCNKSLYYMLYPGPLDPSLSEEHFVDSSSLRHVIKKKHLVRDALASVIRSIKKIDNVNDTVRMGATFFNDRVISDPSFSWGVHKLIRTIVKTFAIDENEMGSTAINDAMQTAYDTIISSNEDEVHRMKNNLEAKKYIVLLTDGENTQDNEEGIAICNKAKSQGIRIMTIAFSVNKTQQEKARYFLSNCASPNSFFEANSTHELNKIFRDRIGNEIFERVIRITK
ncbi:VWA domain-containing protein [Candidatus Liberibacter asiaticus]|uniref:VWFA domain-containing protein n=3 Tax=Liberibacter asiaticus TaxID=34021 RepID=C6XHW8_LIBAP|nr:VWA domain-containing protein [Candidatus Liberibacter asiaticus]ACT56861.1 hypothetical protein CLIBASIA_01365 [Candidatus Liberibacter asiaticus str. psy62]AGH16625.1 hypothetical protein WSI_01275 [Candidatus Liberibacter asiaticus str. gxpsy]ALK07015.1 VWA domain-containing protein [Candidatus Liberibacter asiaticus]ASK52485.1 hypothetical protein B2I23_01315 [Candidatus Liberibacter asiaticus]AWL13810.1 VWA domain-containing protein [Candidatus Liberibacter asiaticus]